MDMTPHFPIYLDYGATTPVDPTRCGRHDPLAARALWQPASRSHAWGWEAEEAVEKARAQVADLIGADPREIVWTSGATESINLALKGAAQFYKARASTSSPSRPSTRPCWTPCASWSARALK
jgi:cysteine desulfurase